AEGLAESAHDLSDGGLAGALGECSFGTGEIGAQGDLDSDLRPGILCFHEGPSRVLISTAGPKRVAATAGKHALTAPGIGRTQYDGVRTGDSAARCDARQLGDRDAAERTQGGTGIVCSINFTTNAA